MLLNGKVAVITGGSRGIGFATVKVFLEEGAKVVFFGSKQETVDAALAKLKEINPNYDVIGLCPKITDEAELAAGIKTAVTKFGRLDILVNNAGISQSTKIGDYKMEDFKELYDINVFALFAGCKIAAEIMKEQGGGVILNTSSYTSLHGSPAGCAYPSSKYAVSGITRSLARELGPSNIRVNAVAPGVTATDLVAALPEKFIKPMVEKTPLRKMVQPEDIAYGFLYLASEKMAGSVSGVILPIDACGTNY